MTNGELIRALMLHDMGAEVVIRCTLPHSTLGPSPSMEIVSVSPGIDWNSGKVFLGTLEPLMAKADVAALRCHAFDQILGWYMDESEKTKSVFRKLVGNIISSYQKKADALKEAKS